MGVDVLRFREGALAEAITSLQEIPSEHGRFQLELWPTSFLIHFTPFRSAERITWQTHWLDDLKRKVNQLVQDPESASSLLYQPQPVDPDGGSDDLR